MRRVLLLAVVAAAAAAVGVPRAAADVTWCGSGETAANRLPDAVAGPLVHVIYAYAADEPDGFAAAASQIASDVDKVDSWWRGQDPTRTPRFDLYAFPGCTGPGSLDISSVRLSLTAAQLEPSATRFQLLEGAIPSLDPGVKPLVFYDGPLGDPTLCGSGTGDPDTGAGSLAVVYMRSTCMGTTDRAAAVVAHELTHELGAPSIYAPHACPGDLGHVCDAPNDLMYPYLTVDSIDQLVLDVGHDDYYREGGRLFDLSTSAWLRHLDAPQQPLTVAIVGGGSVAGNLPGVACTADCVSRWDDGSSVVLTATPAPGRRFVGWRGACAGTYCAPTLTVPTSVEAVFGPATVRLTAQVAGRGRIAGAGVSCPGRCAASVPAGRLLLLHAAPARGWVFVGWGGACKGARPTCRFAPAAATAVRARFRRSS